MIKALIVDDENLVRKGIISFMPWERFNIEIVGEASNGEKALEFIQNNEIDLLVTDLTMPAMSGLDLTAQRASGAHHGPDWKISD